MGREDHVLHAPKRMAFRQWLRREHVEGGAFDAPLAKCSRQRRFVCHAASGNIDQHRVGPHRREGRSPDQPARRRQQRDRNHDEIRPMPEIRQIRDCVDLVGVGVRRRSGPHPKHGQAHRLGPAGNRLAGVTETQDQDGPALDRCEVSQLRALLDLRALKAPEVSEKLSIAASAYSAIIPAATPAAMVTVSRAGSQGARWSVPEPPTETHFTPAVSTRALRGKRGVPPKRTKRRPPPRSG